MAHTYLILCTSAFFAGAINAVAGGGTLLTFPALTAALGFDGPATVMANATSTVALVPGSVSALWSYRRELAESRSWALLLLAPSLTGGLLGSLLVVLLPSVIFKMLVPWLILTAALLFALQPQIARWMGLGKHQESTAAATKIGVVTFQFFVAIYGGYFGAGIGILMLSALAMMGMEDIHCMNAVKTLLAAVINGISAAVFIYKGTVHWPFALAMAAASIVGGVMAAAMARKLNRHLVRTLVVSIGLGLAAYYFYQQFAGSLG